MISFHRSRAAWFAALFAMFMTSQVMAQTQYHVSPPDIAQGLFSGWSVGFTARGAPQKLLIRTPGVLNGVPKEWNTTDFPPASQWCPDYSTAALVQSWLPGSKPDFGDISTGNDQIPHVDSTGHLVMNWGSEPRWYTITVAVAGSAQGKDGGSMVALRRAAHTTADGDILSYYVVGSSRINTSFVDGVYLESSREQLQVSGIAGGSTTLGNLDYGVGAISRDPNNQTNVTFPVRNSFYFTLSKTWLQAYPGLQLAGQQANASTVYKMTWSMVPTPGW